MKQLLSLLALTFIASRTFGQAECNGTRYLQPVFSNVNLTSNITYGQNYNLQGNLQSLELDIYEPAGDAAALRPLIVMEHGGSFVGGDKTGPDITELATPFAKMGYVVASVEYRLGMEGLPFPGPDSGTASEAVWRAVADFKAAVRWFYKDVITNGNQYRIDTNRLFIGGVSAGAVSALHLAYLDDIAEMPAYIDTTKQGLGGGIEGSSGNAGYSSKAQAVVSVCGMIADTAWMQPGDEPIVSLHGTADDVVPYGTDIISVLGFYQIFEVDGSQTVHVRANEIGINNCLHTWPGAPHTPEVGNATYTDTVLTVVKNFLYPYACGGSAQCGYFVGNDRALAQAAITAYPNPNNGLFQIQVPDAWTGDWEYAILDLTGRTVHAEHSLRGNSAAFRQFRLPAGIYNVVATDGVQRGVQKLVVVE